MNCEEFKDKVSPMIDGELSEEEKGEFTAHRAGCASCDSYASEIEKVDALLKGAPLPDLPPELVDRLKEIELEWTVPPVRWGPYVREYLISVAAVAAVLFVSTMGAGYWKDVALTLIPAVAWAAVFVRLTVNGVVPAGFRILEARKFMLREIDWKTS